MPKPSVTTGTSRIAPTTSAGSFAEDASRIRCNPGIFARLRSFAANILRFNGIHNVSDGRHRIAFGGISAILAMRVMY